MRSALFAVVGALLQAQSVPDAAEQAAILARATTEALRYGGQIPSFYCEMVILREQGSAGPPERWKVKDTLDAQITYEDGNPVVTLVSIDGKPTRKKYARLDGIRSDGVLGAGIVPRHVFDPLLNPQFTWKGWDTIGDRRVQAFTFHVAPFLSIKALGKNAVVGFRGEILLDPETARVVRLYQDMYSNSPGYPFGGYVTEFDYGDVTIGDQEHYLPIRAREFVRRGNNLSRNAITFTGYRKYTAQSVVTFQ
jgi:hypothetical protein